MAHDDRGQAQHLDVAESTAASVLHALADIRGQSSVTSLGWASSSFYTFPGIVKNIIDSCVDKCMNFKNTENYSR